MGTARDIPQFIPHRGHNPATKDHIGPGHPDTGPGVSHVLHHEQAADCPIGKAFARRPVNMTAKEILPLEHAEQSAHAALGRPVLGTALDNHLKAFAGKGAKPIARDRGPEPDQGLVPALIPFILPGQCSRQIGAHGPIGAAYPLFGKIDQ